MNKTNTLLLTAIIATPLMMHAPLASADKKAEDKIKFRQSGYMFMRWNMGKIKNQVIKNPESYNKEQVIASANVIAAISKSGIEKLFTATTQTGKGWKKTRVKPEFFNKPEDINNHMRKLKENADRLVEVANTGDISNIKNQFNDVLKVCKSCHKKYREKN